MDTKKFGSLMIATSLALAAILHCYGLYQVNNKEFSETRGDYVSAMAACISTGVNCSRRDELHGVMNEIEARSKSLHEKGNYALLGALFGFIVLISHRKVEETN